MTFIDKVRSTIQRYAMLSAGDRVLIGLSGGPDSVCLLNVLCALKSELELQLYAVYIDHGLRLSETPDEIEFCREMCGSLGILIKIRKVDVISHVKRSKLTKQEAARELRYKVFEELATVLQVQKIALGHNADDQAETIIMRLIRGTGPSGLAGIPPVRKYIIRPLIEIERDDIEAFLGAEGIGFIVDSSNLKDEYFRNNIRHNILPVIKKINPDVIRSISKTTGLLRDEEHYFDVLVTKTLMKLISRKTDTMVDLFLTPLETMNTVLLRRVLRRVIDETRGLRGITFLHIEEIVALVKSGKAGDRIYLPAGIRVIRRYATLTLTSDQPSKIKAQSIQEPGNIPVREASFIISLKLLPADAIGDVGNGKDIAVFDADKLRFPLMLRSRKPGDFFYPLGFGKRKKLQDYFVDAKIPRDERDTIPLLCNGEDIVWVVGHRADERYRVDNTTTSVLECEIKPFKP